ncbi:MAG: ATP-grasp domain-containing protein [Methanomicrobiales archaeon]|nr:ATP-grasp domain-containing protein [Methanomicrobiales archaeon]
MQQHVLVAGFSTRHVVQSAYKAGYITYAVDHFCDQDLFWYTRDRMRFEELEEIPGCIQALAEKYPIDFLVVTSGAEHLRTRIPLLGTPADRIARLLDKEKTHQFFTELGIPTPTLVGEGAYPMMVKPVKGAGGWRNRVLLNDAEKSAWIQEFPDTPRIFQHIVKGTPASVSCLSDGKRGVAVAVNEQILQGSKEAPYGFAGCITPIDHPEADEMIRLAEKAAGESGCIGSLGVDFVLSEEAWAIEVNPRFQATLDTVEMATGCNLFRLHARAFSGDLPGRRPPARRFASRRIMFAERDFELRGDLARFAPAVADIPWPGSHFEEGNAVVSVFGHGLTREAAEQMLNTNITGIRRYIQQ